MGGKSGGDQTTTSEVVIPEFLRPFIEQGAGTAGRALGTLETLLTGPSPGTRTVTDLPEGAFVSNGRVVLRETTDPGFTDEVGTRRGFVPGGETRLVDLGAVSDFQRQEAIPGGAPDASQLVAPLNADQQLGLDLARAVAVGDDPTLSTAIEGVLSTARGDFLAAGPGFDAALEAAQNQFVPQVLSRFGSGSGLADAAIAQGTTDSFANLFNAERSRQQAALGALPGLGLLPSQILLNTGDVQRAQEQAELTAPITATQGLLNATLGGLPVSSLLGRSQTTSTPSNSNPFLTALGVGLTGLSLATGFGALAPVGLSLAAQGVSGGAGAQTPGLGTVGPPQFNPVFN